MIYLEGESYYELVKDWIVRETARNVEVGTSLICDPPLPLAIGINNQYVNFQINLNTRDQLALFKCQVQLEFQHQYKRLNSHKRIQIVDSVNDLDFMAIFLFTD